MSTATLTRAVADTAARTLRAAVYLRISDDKLGTEAGVDRQREDTLARLHAEGYTVVRDGDDECHVDNDISAFTGKDRPAYRRLLARIAAGEVDVVIAWHPERLHRNMTELEEWIALTAHTGTPVHTIREGLWNLATPGGRLVARQLGAVAVYESEHKRERVRRAMVQNAARGKAHGPLRTYGIAGTRQADGSHTWALVEPEAAVVREMTARVLAGEALGGVVRDLNARGIPTLHGKRWATTSARLMLMSARIAGWREHSPGRGRNTRKGWAGGEFVAPAEWPAIVSREEVERVRRILGDPARQHGPRGRTYLLSGGLLVCTCGHRMAGRVERGRRGYRCNPETGGCGRVSIDADSVEAYVEDEVRDALADGRLGERIAARDEGAGNAAWDAVVRARTDLTDLAGIAGKVTPAEYLVLRETYAAALDEAEAELARCQETESAALLAGGLDAWDARWTTAQEAGDLSRLRALLGAALLGVVVAPAVRGRNRFDPDRVDPRWRV